MLNYTTEHHWDEHSSQAVMEGLKNFNERFIGIDQPQKLSIIVRNEERQIIAGLLGETKWNWMYIGWVWVNESYRKHGIGTQLMSTNAGRRA